MLSVEGAHQLTELVFSYLVILGLVAFQIVDEGVKESFICSRVVITSNWSRKQVLDEVGDAPLGFFSNDWNIVVSSEMEQ